MDEIAIVGVACLFPGAHTPAEFWQALLAGSDLTSDLTAEQIGVDPAYFYQPHKGQSDSFYCMRGGYVRDFVFDPQGYRLPADSLRALDEQFTWPLSVARQALLDSGHLQQSASLQQCGLVLGSLAFPTRASSRLFGPLYSGAVEQSLQELLQQPDLRLEALAAPDTIDRINGQLPGAVSAVVARALGLGGPYLAMDAACATSLYTVNLARHYLLAGKADLMLAGAVSCLDPLYMYTGFSLFQAYPTSEEHSRPLDRTSRGLYSAEGAGMFVLKRRQDALRDGDRIYAVLKGAGWSNDGKGKHALIPNPAGQLRAFERAYADAQIDPASVPYVECHATGTPIGDKTELDSMETFFGQAEAAPYVGSVKSNVGHLLTAAGMTAMLKVIYALQQGKIPPTINIQQPFASSNNRISSRHVVTSLISWPDSAPVRRAGVSAFGFGGVNAHLILEHNTGPAPQPAAPDNARTALQPLAIVGMDACFGGCPSLDAFARTIYDGEQHFGPLPAHRWHGLEDFYDVLTECGYTPDAPPMGAYIDQFDIDFRRFKIPPIERDQPIPQHLLMLNVADNALRDAGLTEGGNVAVLVVMGTDLSLHRFRGRLDLGWQIRESLERAGIALSDEELADLTSLARDSLYPWPQVNQYVSFIGNIIASRVSALWNFSGPAFTISCQSSGTARALEVAQMLLSTGDVDAVLVGAVDLAGGLEHMLVHDQAVGGQVGEGAGAVVLRQPEQAHQGGQRIYATIDAVSLTHSPAADAPAQAARQAWAAAGITAADTGYLEVVGGLPAAGGTGLDSLLQSYQGEADTPDCALGSVAASIGYTFQAAGMASLIKTALCLYQRIIPAVPNWQGPGEHAGWQQSRLYVAPESRFWFAPAGAARRTAAISEAGSDGTCAHLVLAENPQQADRSHGYLQQQTPRLYPLVADSQEGLLAQLDDLAQLRADATTPAAAAQRCFDRWRDASSAAYTLVLLAADHDDLQREIERARGGVSEAFASGSEWKTPNGSYFTPQPLGRPGKLAFVYPGAFNAYLGLGQHLFQLYPDLFNMAHAEVPDIESVLNAHLLYPRSLAPLSAEHKKNLEARLVDEPIKMLETGTGFAMLYTMLMRHYFKLQPAMAFGYSQGETAMLHALDAWSEHHELSTLLHSSPLYQTRLSGPQQAVREYWQDESTAQPDDDVWANYILIASAEKVLPHLEDEPRVYLAIINSPREVMISGDPAGCQRVIRKVRCRSLRAPFNHVIHSPPVHSEYDELVRINTTTVRDVPAVQFYSAADYAPMTLGSGDKVAHSIARVCCNRLDFARLVQRVYDDGARIFVELGPARNCTHWIETILKGQEHMAVAINKKGVPDHTSVVRLLARLCSHQVPLDLAPLYAPAETQPTRHGLVRSIAPGGPRLRDMLLTPAQQERFAHVTHQQAVAVNPAPAQPYEHAEIAMPSQPVSERLQPADPVAASTRLPEPPHNGAQPLDLPPMPTSSRHTAFLHERQETLRHLDTRIQQYMADLQDALQQTDGETPTNPLQATSQQPALPPFVASYSQPAHVVWDEADLLEFAGGSIARVFGEEYAIIDSYARRVRLPEPPYLLVSRITHIDGQRGTFKPCSITTEYDIPQDAWYTTDRQASWAVSVESGQCDLLLISYLGIDFEARGERVYRLLDCTLTFMDDLPFEGQTLRYDIAINSFARSGGSLLFFFSYDCYVGERLVLKMTGGCAGFFTDQELAGGKGIIRTEKEMAQRRAIQPRHFQPLLRCERTSFDRRDIQALSVGDIAACFGPHYQQSGRNHSLRLPPPRLLMLDRIVSVDPQGGPWGLGEVVAEQDLSPECWFFPCHFKDDQVLAGSLMAEGCVQVMQFYVLYLGLQCQTSDARFQPIPNQPQVVTCRGQVVPSDQRLTYRLEVTDIGLEPRPYAVGNVDILLGDKIVVNFTGVGIQLSEKQE